MDITKAQVYEWCLSYCNRPHELSRTTAVNIYFKFEKEICKIEGHGDLTISVDHILRRLEQLEADGLLYNQHHVAEKHAYFKILTPVEIAKNLTK